MSRFSTATGRMEEGAAWFERILTLRDGPSGIVGRATFEAGLLAFWMGRTIVRGRWTSARSRSAVEGEAGVRALAHSSLALEPRAADGAEAGSGRAHR